MPAKSLKINLTPKDEFESSLIGRVLKWALTAGKSIVVLTEFVVILAFLSRFKLDMDLNDLNESIMQKQAIVESYSEVESEMRSLLAHTAVVKTANSRAIGIKDFFTDLSESTPREIRLDSIDLTNNSLSIKGGSSTEAGLAALFEGFKAKTKYASVDVGEIQFNQRRGLIEFSLTARTAVSPTPKPTAR